MHIHKCYLSENGLANSKPVTLCYWFVMAWMEIDIRWTTVCICSITWICYIFTLVQSPKYNDQSPAKTVSYWLMHIHISVCSIKSSTLAYFFFFFFKQIHFTHLQYCIGVSCLTHPKIQTSKTDRKCYFTYWKNAHLYRPY